MPTALVDIEAKLNTDCRDILGHDISYTPSGSGAQTIRVQGDYTDGVINSGYSQGIDQDIEMQILMADLATKPASADRITLPRVTGKIFQPTNVMMDEAGMHWIMNLKRVAA